MRTFEYLSARTPSGLLSNGDVSQIVGTLRRDGLAVLPTETGYLLAAAATSVNAIRKAFTVKGRDPANPMHVACGSIEMAAAFAQLTPAARRLLEEFTPGPLSVVVRQTARLPDRLVTLAGTVGIRIPDHSATLQVVTSLGVPVTATSLNRAGQESAGIDRHELEELDWPEESVYIVEDDAAIRYSMPSTLVRLTGETAEVLRQGPVGEDDVLKVIDGVG